MFPPYLPTHQRRLSAGFTYIEIMVIAIVFAILAAVALSTYGSQTRKHRLLSTASSITSLLNQARVQSQTGDQGFSWQVTFASTPASATLNCVTCPASQGKTYRLPSSVRFSTLPITPIIFKRIISRVHHPDVNTPYNNTVNITLQSSTKTVVITVPPYGPITHGNVQ